MARMPSASRGRIGGIGPSGATAGVGVLAAGAPDDAATGAPPPAIAATALWQDADSLAELLSRHCRAAAPPGWTPPQLAMKSDSGRSDRGFLLGARPRRRGRCRGWRGG